jgi:arginase
MSGQPKLQIIGVPMDLGQNQRGVDLGPGALRYAGLLRRLRGLNLEVADAGNLPVPVREMLDSSDPDAFLRAVQQVCETLCLACSQAIAEGYVPLVLGGDHSLAVGSVAGSSSAEPVSLLWIDAHGDFNTLQSSPSGSLHGMPLAALIGEGAVELTGIGFPGAKVQARDVVLFGVRDLDQGERRRLKQSAVRVYTMRDIDERGAAPVLREALDYLDRQPRLHVSLDIDVIDPHEAAGVGTPVPGGLTYREAQLVMEIIADTGRLVALDLVEVNPILDQGNRTADMAVALIASLFGKRIL